MTTTYVSFNRGRCWVSSHQMKMAVSHEPSNQIEATKWLPIRAASSEVRSAVSRGHAVHPDLFASIRAPSSHRRLKATFIHVDKLLAAADSAHAGADIAFFSAGCARCTPAFFFPSHAHLLQRMPDPMPGYPKVERVLFFWVRSGYCPTCPLNASHSKRWGCRGPGRW